MCRKILPRRPCLVQVKSQITLLPEYANAAQNLPGPRFSNRYDPNCIVAGLLLVVCIQTRVTEVGLRIQPGPNGTLDTCVVDEQIELGYCAIIFVVQYTIVHVVEGLVKLVVVQEIPMGSLGAWSRHAFEGNTIFAEIRRA